MGSKTLNYRLVSQYISYSVDDISQLFGVHKNTVRNWLSAGLEAVDSGKPILVYGAILKKFIKDRRATGKVSLKDYEIYCFRCREARESYKESATISCSNNGGAYLIQAKCSVCNGNMSKKITRKQIKNLGRKIYMPVQKNQKDIQTDWVNANSHP